MTLLKVTTFYFFFFQVFLLLHCQYSTENNQEYSTTTQVQTTNLRSVHIVSFDKFLSGFILNGVFIIHIFYILPEIISEYQKYALLFPIFSFYTCI